MSFPVLSVSRRTRRTPFTNRVEAAGVKGYTVYNHMLLPTFFDSVEADYRHLKSHVQVWDVACERQVEIHGPDAAKLVQMLTPRALSRIKIGQCLYTPMVDEEGGMLNDPLTIKLADDRYWVSIADSDLLLWVKGLALGFGLAVQITEPDVSPLAVQGPKADDLAARVFGDAVRNIRFFRSAWLPFQGQDFLVARSGYSKQGGFEIYVEGAEWGEPIWDALFAAGGDLDVRAGCPNLIERIEAALLSYGNDMTREHTPDECGLEKFCDTASACVGHAALQARRADGLGRQIRSLAIDGDPVPTVTQPWPIFGAGKPAGQVTSAAWSPDFQTNVGIGMIDRAHWHAGAAVEIETPAGMRTATIKAGPFI